MKKIIVVVSLLIAAQQPVALHSLGFDTVAHVFSPAKAPVVAGTSSKESREKFLAEFQEFLSQEESSHPQQTNYEKITTQINLLNDKLSRATHASEREIFSKEISTYNQLLQLVVDRDTVMQRLRATYEEMKKVFDGIASDPSYSKVKTEERAAYSFDDLTQLNQKIIDAKNKQSDLKSNAQKLQGDIDRYTRSIEQLSVEIKEKVKQQKNYSTQTSTHTIEGDLIDVQGSLLSQRKELTQLKLKEAESRLVLVNVQLTTIKAQLDILEHDYIRVKQATVIPLKDVKKAEAQLEEKSQNALVEQAKLRQEKMEYVLQKQGEIKKEINEIVTQYNLSASDLDALRDWSFQPKTITQWQMFAAIVPLIAYNSLHETGKEYIQAMIDLSKTDLRREALEVEIKKSWYKFMSRKFRSENDRDIDASIKDYEATKGELVTQLRTTNDNRDVAITSLQRFNKSLESIKGLMETLKDQRRALFKDENAFQAIQKSLREAEEYIRQRIDTTAKLVEKYQAIVTSLDGSLKRVSSMLSELTTKGFWKRSDQSIEWSKVKNIIPDLQRFVHGVYVTGVEYFTLSNFTHLLNTIVNYLKDPLYLLMFIINGLLLCIIFMLLRLFLPDLYQFLQAGIAGAGFIGYVRLWAALCIKFIMLHMTGIFIWGFFYLLAISNVVQDTYVTLLIELLSIPYLLYLVHQFMAFILRENRNLKYSIVNQSYERRFYIVISTVLSSLAILYFLRNALLLDSAISTDLSNILLAFMFIVIQIGLICLIGKKQILSIIPEDTPLWEWIKEHIEKYYYLFFAAVIVIIIMSNPYVGYGKQVFYILSRLFLTLLIIPLFLWIHSRLKNMSSNLFFYYEEGESLRERFSSGRLWYGIFIIASFAVFIVALVFALGAIWGRGVVFSDIVDFLNRELTAVKDEAGRDISVTLFSLLQIVLFVLGGIFLNYVINQFVLKRVFDPFLVGVGVQNTISAFTKYAIILLAVFIGLSNAGLEGLTTKFAIIIGGLGFALQEPLRDFFSYFIILVQRPVKIGDLIQINDEVIGIVRHITPRSVVLRRRNSVTVIVPNSQIILNPVVNWSYSRSYFAFNDIMITVAYTRDPQRVKEILLSVLHNNPMILKSPAPIVWLQDFVENGYQFLVRGYLTADKVLDQWEISSQVRLELVKKLRENGIEIASPTRIIRMTDSAGETNMPKLPH